MTIPNEVINRAAAAKRLLDDGEFKAAVSQVEENYIAAWKSGKTVDEREVAHHRWAALRDVIAQIKLVFDRGETQKAHDKRHGRG